MNNNTKKLLGIGFIGLATLSAGTAAVSAFGTEGKFLGKAPFGQSEDVQTAIEAGDYEAFQELTNKDITQEEFDFIVSRTIVGEQIQTAIENDSYIDFIDAIADLDREIPTIEMFEDMVERYEAHEKVEQAITQGNYDLWVSAVQDLPHGSDMADIISEDEFSLLMEMHDAREDGDFEEANEIADELGLEAYRGQGSHGERGSHEGMRDGSGEGNQKGSQEGKQKGTRGLFR